MPGDRVRVLAVDDDRDFLRDLTQLMGRNYDLTCATTPQAALEVLSKTPVDAVLLDLNLAGRGDEGFALLESIRRFEPGLPVIMVTQDQSRASVVTALRKGATDFIDKTPDLKDLERRISLALAGQRERLATEIRFLRREIDAQKGEMVGDAPAMRALREMIRCVAQSRKPVLITGETGTGKELVARAIHQASCPESPFVAINCAQFPKDLFARELFGSERGAFSGADRRLPGKFEIAAEGILFLDELTEIDLSMQAALLRVMDAGEFSLLGGTRTMKFEGRVLASTNRNLQEAMAADALRKDLYYRFGAHVISAPPLRERLEDVPLLAGYFLRRAAEGRKLSPRDLHDRDMVRLCAYDWPGNVRELENVIASFAISGRLVVPPLPNGPSHDPHPPAGLELLELTYPGAKEIAVRRFQKEYVPVILAAHQGDVAAAAAQMGISRVGLQKILQQMAEPHSLGEGENSPEE